jgi:hypothetical protein
MSKVSFSAGDGSERVCLSFADMPAPIRPAETLSSLWGTWGLLGRSRRAHVWRRLVPLISFEDALVLYALLTLGGRHGETAWRGQHDAGRTRAAFRTGGRQIAFRHRSQLCERPALLAHVFVRRHRPPTSGQNTSAADQSVAIDYTSWQTGLRTPAAPWSSSRAKAVGGPRVSWCKRR